MDFEKTFPITSSHPLKAFMAVNPQIDDHNVTYEEMIEYVTDQNIQMFIDKRKLRQISSHFNKNHIACKRELIASGIAPIRGEDGHLEWVRDFWDQSVKINKKDKADYYEQSRLKNVVKDEWVALLHPPTEGKPGTDVFGQIIPSMPGKAITVKAGKHIHWNDEDNKFYALSDGQIILDRDTLSIDTVYLVRNDIDFKESNVNFSGKVIITGNVNDLFKVEAGESIEIMGLAEAATLICEGPITVEGGILGKNKGFIECNGLLKSKKIDNAVVKCRNDIEVAVEIVNSQISCSGQIDIPNGRIVGGEIICAEGINAHTIGGSTGIVSLHVGRNIFDETIIADFKKQIKILVDKQTRISNSVKNLKPMLKHLNAERRAAMTELVYHIQALTMEKESIEVEMQKLLDKDYLHSHITVADKIYAGVTIRFQTETRLLDKDIKGPLRIQWDAKKGQIAILKLDF